MKCSKCGCENASGVAICFSCESTIPMKRIKPIVQESTNPRADKIKTILAIILMLTAVVLSLKTFGVLTF